MENQPLQVMIQPPCYEVIPPATTENKPLQEGELSPKRSNCGKGAPNKHLQGGALPWLP